MYSNIQSISSKPKPLETEAADARLRDKAKNADEEATLHDRDDQRKEVFEDSDNDTNVFSINALIYFLEDFLEARLSSKLNEADEKGVSSIAPWIKTEHSNVNEKPYVQPNRAANAYAHGAEVSKNTAQEDSVETNVQHNNEKVSDVYHLLRDLRDLRDGGISQLNLHKSATFLDGISSAVQTAKLELI